MPAVLNPLQQMSLALDLLFRAALGKLVVCDLVLETVALHVVLPRMVFGHCFVGHGVFLSVRPQTHMLQQWIHVKKRKGD